MIKNELVISLFVIILVVFLGTVGFAMVEGWSLFDSLYMTVITLATIGYKEVHELSQSGRVFTIFLVVFGLAAIAYAARNATRIMLEGELRRVLGRRKVERAIKSLKNHYIVCGYGRMGKIICKELIENQALFVVIEKDPNVLAGMSRETLAIQGDATNDDILKSAAIEHARGLISVLSSDADNLYVVLSARGLNPDLMIVARASEEGSDQKLIRAGADRVVSPYHIGGLRIAHTVLKPAVVDFIEFATRSGNIELQMEEMKVLSNSKLAGMSLDRCGIRKELGIIIVAIKRATGEMEFNPGPESIINTGDTLIVLGESGSLKTLETMAGVS